MFMRLYRASLKTLELLFLLGMVLLFVGGIALIIAGLNDGGWWAWAPEMVPAPVLIISGIIIGCPLLAFLGAFCGDYAQPKIDLHPPWTDQG
jgi:hypothetical protein